MAITHQELVTALRKPGDETARQLTPFKAELWHYATGVAGEAGEILDVVKKHSVYHKELDQGHLIEEMGDIEWYLEAIRQVTGITREECLEANTAKLSKRYPQLTYRDSDARARADKQGPSGIYDLPREAERYARDAANDPAVAMLREELGRTDDR